MPLTTDERKAYLDFLKVMGDALPIIETHVYQCDECGKELPPCTYTVAHIASKPKANAEPPYCPWNANKGVKWRKMEVPPL